MVEPFHGTEPPSVAALPRDHRGIPIPAHVGRVDGTPIRITEFDPNRLILITAERRCTICGWVIDDDELCWWPTEEAHIAAVEAAGWAGWEPVLEGTGHKECIYYSAIACPFLAIPDYVRKTDQRAAGEVRYERGTQRPPVVLCGAPVTYVDLSPTSPPQIIAGGGPRESRAYTNGTELIDELETMVRANPRAPKEGDQEFAELMSSYDADTIRIRVQQAFVEIAIRSRIDVGEPRRNDECTCGSGYKYKKCCLVRFERARTLPEYLR